jgi:hypothetical protein
MQRFCLCGILIAGAIAYSGTAIAQSTPWQLHLGTDPKNDALQAVAWTKGPDGVTLAFFCEKGGDIALTVQVQYIDFRVDTTRIVRWRVDKSPPVQQDWYNSSKSGAGLAGRPAIQVAKQLADAKDRFVVESAGTTVVFSTAGANGAIRKALAACAIVE